MGESNLISINQLFTEQSLTHPKCTISLVYEHMFVRYPKFRAVELSKRLEISTPDRRGKQ